MKPRLAILFCLALVIVAFFCVIFQSRGQAFTPRRPFVRQSVSGTPQTPTNQSDYPYAYYVVSTNWYYTNSGNATLEDQWVYHLHQTNSYAGANPKLNPTNLNGLATLSFSGGQQLENVSYDQGFALFGSRPHELIFVVAWTNKTGSIMGEVPVSNNRQEFYQNGANWTAASYTPVAVGAPISNRWIVLDIIFGGPFLGGAAVLTNGVTMATNLATGSAYEQGLVLGGSATFSTHAAFEFASLITFTNAITQTTRSNIYWFFTNKYNIAP